MCSIDVISDQYVQFCLHVFAHAGLMCVKSGQARLSGGFSNTSLVFLIHLLSLRGRTVTARQGNHHRDACVLKEFTL